MTTTTAPLQQVQEEFEIMMEEDALTERYDEAHRQASRKINEELDVDGPEYVQVFDYLSEQKPEKAYELLEEQL